MHERTHLQQRACCPHHAFLLCLGEQLGSMICVLALGTRGDVEPVAICAAGAARALPDVRWRFVTHAVHEVTLPRARAPRPGADAWRSRCYNQC